MLSRVVFQESVFGSGELKIDPVSFLCHFERNTIVKMMLVKRLEKRLSVIV